MCPGVTIASPSRELLRVPTGKPGLLLTRLAIGGPREYSREQLVEAIWPECDIETGRPRLRFALTVLRTNYDLADAMTTSKNEVSLDWSKLDTDVERFRRKTRAIDLSGPASEVARLLFDEAAALRGDLADQYSASWIEPLRQELRNARVEAFFRAGTLFRESGNIASAEEALRAALDLDRFRDPVNRDLMQLLGEDGRAAEALSHFEEVRRLTLRELGIEPSEQLRRLAQSIARSAPTASNFPPPDEAAVPRPGPIYGRSETLDSIRREISRPGACVVVIGAIGVGKTHLVKEAVWRFSRDSGLPVQLGGDPEAVSDGLFIPSPGADRAATIRAIRDAAYAGWRVLAESNVRLKAEGISELLVDPLPPPSPADDAERILANPSVQILVSDITALGKPLPRERDLASLAELAIRLDGLPAALKVFASRLSVQTPEHVLRTIDDGLAEYVQLSVSSDDTVGSAIDRLTSDLPPYSRDLFHSLALVDGVCADLGSKLAGEHDSAEVWRSLEERCLICVQDDGSLRRYRIPGPIGVTVRRSLTPDKEAELAHRTWKIIAEWAFWQSRLLVGPRQEQGFESLQSELRNLLRGLSWAIDEDPATAAYMVVGIWRTVCARGNPSIDAEVLLKAAISGGTLLKPRMAGEMWVGVQIALSIAGDLVQAEAAYRNAVKSYQEADDAHGVTWANMNYVTGILAKSDLKRATELAKTIADEANQWTGRDIALTFYAMGIADSGDTAEAVRVAEEVFAERSLSKDATTQARAYSDLAQLYQKVGRTEAARPLFVESIRRLRETGVQDFLLDAITSLAELDINAAETKSLLSEAATLAKRIGSNTRQSQIQRLRMAWVSRHAPAELLSAVEDAFRFVQLSQSENELELSLRCLASELDRQRKPEYANAIRASRGDSVEAPANSGWSALLSSDSHATVCVLAVAMAREALSSKA